MLKVEHISVTFNPGTVNAKKALEDLSLEAADGDFITIVGDNGAGKSTLFNAISGRFLSDTGRIFLDGKNITFTPEYKRAKYIGQLFQDPLRGTAPHMTIEENLAMAYLRAGAFHAFSRVTRQDHDMFYQTLKELDMGLEERMNTPVGNLSGGQRQALTLLMATIVPPKLLLLDEHTAALDPAAAEKIMKLTVDIVARQHTTCLMITHNLKQALHTGNRMIMMRGGRIVLSLSQEEKKTMSVEDLLRRFHKDSGVNLDNDRILLSD